MYSCNKTNLNFPGQVQPKSAISAMFARCIWDSRRARWTVCIVYGRHTTDYRFFGRPGQNSTNLGHFFRFAISRACCRFFFWASTYDSGSVQSSNQIIPLVKRIQPPRGHSWRGRELESSNRILGRKKRGVRVIHLEDLLFERWISEFPEVQLVYFLSISNFLKASKLCTTLHQFQNNHQLDPVSQPTHQSPSLHQKRDYLERQIKFNLERIFITWHREQLTCWREGPANSVPASVVGIWMNFEVFVLF